VGGGGLGNFGGQVCFFYFIFVIICLWVGVVVGGCFVFTVGVLWGGGGGGGGGGGDWEILGGMYVFLIFRLCTTFWVGNSLCKNFFKVKRRTWTVESTCSVFFLQLPLHDSFSGIFFWKLPNLFPHPSIK